MGHNGVIKGMLTHVVAHHKNTVTAIAMCPSPGSGKGESTSVYVVTGSKDTTVMLWEVDVASKSPPEKPIHILFGHDDAVSAVAIDADLDMVASVSLDGTCIVHTLKSGVYTLTIRPPGLDDSRLCHVAISSQGYLVVYSRSELRLHLYSINGRPLGSIDVVSPIRTMFVTDDAAFLVTGDEKGNVYVRHVHNLEPVTKSPFNLPWVINDGRRSLSSVPPPPANASSMLQCISVGPGKYQNYLVGAFSGFGVVAARLFEFNEQQRAGPTEAAK